MHAKPITSKFPWADLPDDIQTLIGKHTETIFAVESDFTMRIRFPAVGWTTVPYVIRYELLLARRCLRRISEREKGPEIQVTISRFLKPAFKHSSLFADSDASMQELLVNNCKEIIFPSISAARLEMRDDCAGNVRDDCAGQLVWQGPIEFMQFVSRKHAFKTPFWAKIDRNTINEVRHKLKSMFYMEFDQALCLQPDSAQSLCAETSHPAQ